MTSSSGKLSLKKARDTSTGAWVFGLSLVVLAWTDGKRRIPLAFMPYFGEEESKLALALALLEWLCDHGGSFVTRQAIEEIFRGLQQELGWTGHRHWRRARLLAYLALGWVAYGLIERQREGLGLSFYQCRRRLIAGKLSLDLSPLLPVQVEAE